MNLHMYMGLRKKYVASSRTFPPINVGHVCCEKVNAFQRFNYAKGVERVGLYMCMCVCVWGGGE